MNQKKYGNSIEEAIKAVRVQRRKFDELRQLFAETASLDTREHVMLGRRDNFQFAMAAHEQMDSMQRQQQQLETPAEEDQGSITMLRRRFSLAVEDTKQAIDRRLQEQSQQQNKQAKEFLDELQRRFMLQQAVPAMLTSNSRIDRDTGKRMHPRSSCLALMLTTRCSPGSTCTSKISGASAVAR